MPDTQPTVTPAINLRRLGVHRKTTARDVPYVPTDPAVVIAMLRFAGVTSSDVVYDLGCGDGRIVIGAAKHFGARGVGVDIDPLRIAESREAAAKARVGELVRFDCQSFFETDLRSATVVMLYLLPGINIKLRPKLLAELRPGSRIIANHFEIGDWRPDMSADVHHRTLRQWLVPAAVKGQWRCVVNDTDGRYRMRLSLKQRYQSVTGSAHIGRSDLPLANGRLLGEHLTFKLIDWNSRGLAKWYSCEIKGNQMRGVCHVDAIENSPMPWGGMRIAGS